MKMRLFLSLLSFLFALISAGLAADPSAPLSGGSIATAEWGESYAAAQALAREQKRPILIFFSGLDWTNLCRRMRTEIFLQEAFVRYAEKSLVLVHADFPKKTQQTSALRQQNRQLLRTFKIPYYPTVVLVDAEGRELGRSGYTHGGAKTFVRMLQEWQAPKPAAP